MKTRALLSACCVVLAASCGVPVKEGPPDTEQTTSGLGQPCGTIAGLVCAAGLTCLYDAAAGCDPRDGGADCSGLCGLVRHPEPRDLDGGSAPDGGHGVGAFCGGLAGFACAAGLECVDDPSDWCDPQLGGADCGGICQQPAVDAGHTDGGHSDGGHSDGGHSDGGHSDGGHSDGGHSDGGHSDGGHSDGGYSDGGYSDGGYYDGGYYDGGYYDGGYYDGGYYDGGYYDGGFPGEGDFCSGLTGALCAPGLVCKDDPTDGCNPANGGDCGGICQRPAQGDYCSVAPCQDGLYCHEIAGVCVPEQH